jgi:NADH-quinone oxidoreductase subunit L
LALLRKRFYFDELYSFLIAATQGLLASVSAFLDRWILDVGFIRGASTTTWGIGSLLRFLQVGNLQAYSFLFGLGIVGLIYFTIFR